VNDWPFGGNDRSVLADIVTQLKAIAAAQTANTATLNQISTTVGGKLAAIETQLAVVNGSLEKIMSEDASVLAVVTDETAQVIALGSSVSALQALVVALQAEVAAGGTALQPGTLAALQAAQASLDTLAATGAADVTTDTPAPPVTPPAS
jgi:hypothetical protein